MFQIDSQLRGEENVVACRRTSMKRTSGPGKTANLPDSVHHQLNMYALAAGAAGGGVLALAQTAQARIIYTPAHKQLPINKHFYLDLNHDGINDFKFLLHSQPATSRSFGLDYLRVKGSRENNGIVPSTRTSPGCAAALPKGARIGPGDSFQQGSLSMFFSRPYATFGCPFLGQTQAYLGLKFSVKCKVHFGWARFVTHSGLPPTAELTGYAYETIPGKAIIAGATKGPDDAEPAAFLNTPTPEPATLGALAMGAPGLSIWRRKESALEGE
jgi:hypothetical protein